MRRCRASPWHSPRHCVSLRSVVSVRQSWKEKCGVRRIIRSSLSRSLKPDLTALTAPTELGTEGKAGLTLKLHTDPVGNTLNSPCPESLVQLGVDPYVGGAHLLLSKGDDRFYGGGGTLLKGTTVHILVKVDGVLARHNVLKGGACFAL